MRRNEIICIGEILWDSLPSGLFLGGAPFNVAHDLHRLGQQVGIISRVGRDALGEEVIRRLTNQGMSTELIQIDDLLPTGFVDVMFDGKGNPNYLIKEPVAWDSIEVEEELVRTVSDAKVLVFGTLACRNETTRETIRSLVKSASLRVLDVNLRPGAGTRETVEEALNAADIVKANASELETLRKWFGLPSKDRSAAEKLAEMFACKIVCVSNGARGGGLWHEGQWVYHHGFKVNLRNSVGAGDAFLAGLLTAFLQGKSDKEVIETANLLGAYVVTQVEATPQFGLKDLEAVRTHENSF